MIFAVTVIAISALAAPEARAYSLSSHHEDHDGVILASAVEWGLDPFVVRALLWTESRLDPRARHRRTGCVGIAQICPGGRAAINRLRQARGALPLRHTDLIDPGEAVPAAAELLAHQVERCGSIERGLRAYNVGHCGSPNGFAWSVVRRAHRMRTAAGLPPPPVRRRVLPTS